MYNIEIDKESGFCFGVTTAIKKAEEELAKGTPLYCLGDIVHRIRVFEFFAQFNHFMGNRFHPGFIFIEIIQSLFGTRRQPQKNKECQQTV